MAIRRTLELTVNSLVGTVSRPVVSTGYPDTSLTRCEIIGRFCVPEGGRDISETPLVAGGFGDEIDGLK